MIDNKNAKKNLLTGLELKTNNTSEMGPAFNSQYSIPLPLNAYS